MMCYGENVDFKDNSMTVVLFYSTVFTSAVEETLSLIWEYVSAVFSTLISPHVCPPHP